MIGSIALIGILALGCCNAADLPQTLKPSVNQTVSNMMAASFFLAQLRTDNMIPGFSTNDHGKLMIIPSGNPEPKATYPITVMGRATLDKAPNHLYWFSVCAS
jgi:hypothetical protein